VQFPRRSGAINYEIISIHSWLTWVDRARRWDPRRSAASSGTDNCSTATYTTRLTHVNCRCRYSDTWPSGRVNDV